MDLVTPELESSKEAGNARPDAPLRHGQVWNDDS
jgi:hypothetical protein